MLKGKGSIVYTIMKITLYLIGCWEYLSLGRPMHRKTQMILICILILNSFFRQLYLYEKDKLYRYGQVSIIIEFMLGAWIASLQPVDICIMLLTPAIYESVVAHSVKFGGCTTLTALITLMTIHTMSIRRIYNYPAFFRDIFVSYGLGYVLIFIISYLSSLQSRERERVARTNRELEQAYKQLLDNATKLQELSVEKERTRMAREIHDTLAHTLTAVVVQMEACKKLINVDVSRARTEIEKAQELTRAGLGDVKRTIKALRPQVLENSSLSGALNNLFQNIEETAHVKVVLHESLNKELELTCAAEVALFRVIQESITNAIRHGAADQIDTYMTEKEGNLNIEISDNGKGCPHIKEGYGLNGINERIKSLNGVVRFSSTVGKGFLTQIAIPYKGGIISDDKSDDCG